MFAVVEQKEPHAGRMAFSDIEQPATFAARCALARRIRDELEVPLPIFVDGMDDSSRALFSDLPSPAFVIDRHGRIADKLPWADPGSLQKSLLEVVAKEPMPVAKTAPWTLDQRNAFARRALATGNAGEALAWLDAKSEPAPSVPPTLTAIAQVAITRTLAIPGADATARAAASEAATRSAVAAWADDPARLTAARIEIAEAANGTTGARALWQAALAGLDTRAPSATREWLEGKCEGPATKR